MIFTRPTADEERLLAFAERRRRWRKSGLLGSESRDAESPATETPGAWKTSRLWTRIMFFALGLVCVAALFGCLDVLDVPGEEWITGIACIAIGEWLVRRGRFIHSGIEETLWIAGLYLMIFGLPGPPRNEGLLLFAAASFLAGARLLNGLFVAAALFYVFAYVSTQWNEELGAIVAIVVTIAAVAAATRILLRPFHDRALTWIVLIAPLYASIILVVEKSLTLLVVMAILLGALLAAGLRFRLHPPLLSALIVGVVLAGEISRRSRLLTETELFIWGLLAFAVAIVSTRAFRGRQRGVTSDRILDDPVLGLAEIAGTVVIAPTAEAQPHRGGEFGGGGATTEW